MPRRAYPSLFCLYLAVLRYQIPKGEHAVYEQWDKPVEVRPVTIRKITLWRGERGEIDGSPSALAKALQPLDEVGLRLQAFIRYRHFHDEKRAVIEVCPLTEEKKNRCSVMMFAEGLKISTVPALILAR